MCFLFPWKVAYTDKINMLLFDGEITFKRNFGVTWFHNISLTELVTYLFYFIFRLIARKITNCESLTKIMCLVVFWRNDLKIKLLHVWINNLNHEPNYLEVSLFELQNIFFFLPFLHLHFSPRPLKRQCTIIIR